MNRSTISGLFDFGSGLSVFEATGENSAVEQAAARGCKNLILLSTTITQRAKNQAAAIVKGLQLRIGWIVMTSIDDAPCPLTLFPAGAPETERLFVEWSGKYPRVPFNKHAVLPFGDDAFTPVFTEIPLSEILKHKHDILIFNSPLEEGSIPFHDGLLPYYDGFFIRFDGRHEIPLRIINDLKRLCKNALFLPDFHIGSFSSEAQREVMCLEDLRKPTLMFSLPELSEPAKREINIKVFQQLYGLLSSPSDFFMRTSMNAIRALIPGAKLNAYQAVETAPGLLPSEEERYTLFSELKEICSKLLQDKYTGEEDRLLAEELLTEELDFLYQQAFHGFLLGKTLLALYRILGNEEHCVLVKDNHVPLINYLFRLSRLDPLDDIGNHVKADIVCSTNHLQLETSHETFEWIAEKMYEQFPTNMALIGDEVLAGELIEKNWSGLEPDLQKHIRELNYEERENLNHAVIDLRLRNHENYTIILAPEGMSLPGVRVKDSDIPVISLSFCHLASALVMTLGISCSTTMDRFEGMRKKGLRPRLSKRIEKKLFQDFLPRIDRVLTAGIPELSQSPMLRHLIRRTPPANRYEFAKLFRNCLYGDFFEGQDYHLQKVDVILNMLTARLSAPFEFFETIDRTPVIKDLPTDLLEMIVYDEPIIGDKISEKLEAQLLDEGIEPAFLLNACSVSPDGPLIELARRISVTEMHLPVLQTPQVSALPLESSGNSRIPPAPASPVPS